MNNHTFQIKNSPHPVILNFQIEEEDDEKSSSADLLIEEEEEDLSPIETEQDMIAGHGNKNIDDQTQKIDQSRNIINQDEPSQSENKNSNSENDQARQNDRSKSLISNDGDDLVSPEDKKSKNKDEDDKTIKKHRKSQQNKQNSEEDCDYSKNKKKNSKEKNHGKRQKDENHDKKKFPAKTAAKHKKCGDSDDLEGGSDNKNDQSSQEKNIKQRKNRISNEKKKCSTPKERKSETDEIDENLDDESDQKSQEKGSKQGKKRLSNENKNRSTQEDRKGINADENSDDESDRKSQEEGSKQGKKRVSNENKNRSTKNDRKSSNEDKIGENSDDEKGQGRGKDQLKKKKPPENNKKRAATKKHDSDAPLKESQAHPSSKDRHQKTKSDESSKKLPEKDQSYDSDDFENGSDTPDKDPKPQPKGKDRSRQKRKSDEDSASRAKDDKKVTHDDIRSKQIKKLAKKTHQSPKLVESILDLKQDYKKSFNLLKTKRPEELEKYIKKKSENNKKNIAKMSRKNDTESVSFTTYIELDMHGSDPRITRALDWVPIIRDALLSALQQDVDIVSFIPGKGLHSDPLKGPVLRPLVLLTSKRLGFDSFINPQNTGIVICNISSYHGNDENDNDDDDENNEEILKTFGVHESHINTNDYLDLQDDEDDDDNDDFEDDNAFNAVRRKFPKMPKICVEIIIERRNPKEAVKFAELFELYLQADDPRDVKKGGKKKRKMKDARFDMLDEQENREKNEKMIKEKKRVEKFEEIYGIDREVIEQVVSENPKKAKAEHVLDRICDEIQPGFYETFLEYIEGSRGFPVESLLDVMKQGDYNVESINEILNGQSVSLARKALNVMNVSNKIKSKRGDGKPKFIPKIEIDLTNAGIEKAKRSVGRIMNGLQEKTFSEMVLQFGNNKDRCNLGNIGPFVKETAHRNGYHLNQTKSFNKCRYFITNEQNDEDNEDYDEEDDFNKSIYYKLRRNNKLLIV